MNARLFALLAALCAVGTTRADVVTLAAPASYTPGTPFTVNVGLTPLSNLGLYNVELVFRAAGASGSWLVVDPPAAAASGYVFPTTSEFAAAVVQDGDEVRVTLSDFILAATGPDVTSGVNDRLSAITVRPAPTLTTAIEVSIDRSSLFVDDADENSLLADGSLPELSVAPPVTDPTPVPAPAGVVLVAVGFAALVARRLRRPVRAADATAG